MVEEDEEPFAHTSTATALTIFHDKVNTMSGCESSEPPSRSSADQDIATTSMDVEADARGCQAANRARMPPSFQVSDNRLNC